MCLMVPSNYLGYWRYFKHVVSFKHNYLNQRGNPILSFQKITVQSITNPELLCVCFQCTTKSLESHKRNKSKRHILAIGEPTLSQRVMTDPGETTESTTWPHLFNVASRATRELQKTVRVRDTIGKEGSGESFMKEGILDQNLENLNRNIYI